MVPYNTQYGNAVEGFRRQPCGITLWKAYAACLDVRTKDLYGIPIGEHAALWAHLCDIAVDLAMENHAGLPPPGGAAAPAIPPPAALPPAGVVGGLAFNRGPAPAAPVAVAFDMRQHLLNSVRIEIVQFQAVVVVNNIRFDTLAWWKLNRQCFPLLANAARLVLAVPGWAHCTTASRQLRRGQRRHARVHAGSLPL